MNSFQDLLAAQPLTFLHLASALGAVVLGAVLLWARKGSLPHRLLGWTWVGLMGTAAASSAGLRSTTIPNIDGVTPIHALTAVVLVLLPLAVVAARRRRVDLHRKLMTRLYLGGCAIAGLFTLLPGRFLGRLLWSPWLGLAT